jgi:hypothetical protein
VTKNKKGTKLVDDAVNEQRRRSSRVNSDANTMDKAVDLAKKKNLETISGIPTVINSSSCTLNGIATSIGVRLGQNAIEAEGIINAMKELEEARFNLFLASKRGPDKLGVEDTCKINSFDPEGIRDNIASSSGSDSSTDNEDFDACIRGLASLSRLNRHRNSVNRVRGRGRGFSVHMGTDKLTSRQLLF